MKMFGASYAFVPPNKSYQRVSDAYLDYIRVRVHWSRVEKFISAELDFTIYDEVIAKCEEYNLTPIFEVGLGFAGILPYINENSATRFDPQTVGKSPYLTNLLRFTAACLERYHDKVPIWGIETELNAAYPTGVFGWRSFNLSDSVWKDVGFCNDIINKLSEIVRGKGCRTITQIHTDIPDGIFKQLKLPTVRETIRLWDSDLDYVGLSMYPFYFNADLSEVYDKLTHRIQSIAEVTSKPIVILESGYPVAKFPEANPKRYNFTNEAQAEYTEIMMRLVSELSLAGIFYFKVNPIEGFALKRKVNSKDEFTFEILERAFEIESLIPLYNLLWYPGVAYLQNEFVPLIMSVERGFGNLFSDYTGRLSYFRLKERVMDMKQKTISLRRGNNLVAFPGAKFESDYLFESIPALQTIFYLPPGASQFKFVTEKDEKIAIDEMMGYLLIVREDVEFRYLAE